MAQLLLQVVRGAVEHSLEADVFSLGQLLYELASGNVPYCDCDAYQTRINVVGGVQPQLPGGCPSGYADLVGRCRSMNAAERPSMKQVRVCGSWGEGWRRWTGVEACVGV